MRPVEIALERLVFRRALLNEDRRLDSTFGFVEHADTRGVGLRGEAQSLHRGPGRVDERAQPCVGVGARGPTP